MVNKAYIVWHLISLTILNVCELYAEQLKPNVIFILVDDQGYYDLSCYGATEVKTKRIDQLAGEGIRFTDYYAAAPICSPSRAGFITGCYPRRVGNGTWVHRPDSESGINPDELTIAELFQQNDYRTACIGKWHLGFKEPFLPLQQGFDHYYGLLHNLDTYESPHYDDEGGVPVLRNGEVVIRPADPAQLARLYTEEAIQWIESCMKENKRMGEDKPFFLYLPHTMLYNPLGVSEAFIGTSNWGQYGDAIQEMDHYVGILIDKLNELSIDQNTIVVYTSDNGRQPGRNADQPIRGSKLSTLEGGLRVPCILWGPGLGIQAGLEISEVVHAMDWFPTLSSLSGIKVPEDLVRDGRDLSNLLLGETKSIPEFSGSNSLNAGIPLRRYWNPPAEWRETVDRDEYLNAFFYHGSQGELSAVRSGKWKLFLTPSYTLYDLEADPGESDPVRNSQIISKLRGMAVMFQEELRLHSRPAGQFSE